MNRVKEHFVTMMDIPFDSIRMEPDLPKVKFKRGKVTYEVTDYKYLNNYAYATMEHVFQKVIEEGARFVNLDYSNLPDDEVEKIIDILMATRFTAKSRGHWCDGHLLVSGAEWDRDLGEKVVVFRLIEDNVKKIYEDAVGKTDYSLSDAVVAVAREYMEA